MQDSYKMKTVSHKQSILFDSQASMQCVYEYTARCILKYYRLQSVNYFNSNARVSEISQDGFRKFDRNYLIVLLAV